MAASPGLTEIATTTLRNRSMPVGPTKTKVQKQKVVHTEMRKFKEGELHSGSKNGPKVTSRKQAIAISLSESGQSKNKPSPRGGGESKPGYDRSGHRPGNPGFAESRHQPNQSYAQEQREHWGSKAKGTKMGKHPVQAHVGSEKRGTHLIDQTNGPGNAKQPQGHSIGIHQAKAEHHKGFNMGAGHTVGHSSGSGHLRMSGHPGAHRIGKK